MQQSDQKYEQKWEDFTNEVRKYFDSNDVVNKIHEMRQSDDKKRLSISFDYLRQKHSSLVETIMKEPLKAFRIFEKQLENVIKDLGGDQSKQAKRQIYEGTKSEQSYRITFEGSLGSNLVTPRGLTSRLVNNFVGVQGIVTATSRVRPRLLKSVHYNEKTDKSLMREYVDKNQLTDELKLGMPNAIPIYDEDKNP